MPRRLIPLAICYDFDGTLAPGNMQERDFIPQIGMNTQEFWSEVRARAREHSADQILIYMKIMLEKAQAAKVPVRIENFQDYGANLTLFDGVFDSRSDNWFKRINNYARSSGVGLNHFIVSSGIKEMILGTPISNYFRLVYASSFVFDHNGVAQWPALALNYTTKTQYLFRINKGSLDVWDDSVINAYVEHDDRPVPFSNMIFVGDGLTDIPCFRLLKDLGGHSIAVYEPRKRKAKKQADQLFSEGRVNFTAPTDYRDGSLIDNIVKKIIDKVAFDTELKKLGTP